MKVRLFTGLVLLVCIALLASLVPSGRRSGGLVQAASPAAAPINAQGVELVGHIDGFVALSLAVQGDYVYVAGYDGGRGIRGLWVLDVSTPSNPTEVGFYNMPASALDVAVQGDYVYATGSADEWNGSEFVGILRVLDVSTPSSPTQVGFYETSARSGARVVVQGDYAYVTDVSLRVLDISTPSNPTEVGSYIPVSGTVSAIAVAGSYAYVGSIHPGPLRVIDITTPSAPTEVGFYELSPDRLVRDMTVTGNYVYAISNLWEKTGVDIPDLRVVNISAPSNPTEVAIYDTPARAVAAQGEYIYAASYEFGSDSNGSLQVLDTSAPSNLTEVGFYKSPELYARDVVVSGDYIYVAAGYSGLCILRLQPYITKQVTASSRRGTVGLNDTLTYTLRIFDPDDGSLVLCDRVPTYTTYISGSLSAPAGVVYNPSANAISGTLNLTAGEPETVTFAVQVGVMGTAGFAPLITNRACVYPVGGGLADCEWSNEVRSYTYAWPIYLPLVVRNH